MAKVKIHIKEELPKPADVESRKDFKKLVFRYEKQTKPLYKIPLYKYKYRYYFIGIVILLLLLYLIYEATQ